MVPWEKPTEFGELTVPPRSWKWRRFVSAKTLFEKIFNESLMETGSQKHFSFPFYWWSLRRKLKFTMCRGHYYSIIFYLKLISPPSEIGIIIICLACRKFYYSLKVPWNTTLCDLKLQLKTIGSQKNSRLIYPWEGWDGKKIKLGQGVGGLVLLLCKYSPEIIPAGWPLMDVFVWMKSCKTHWIFLNFLTGEPRIAKNYARNWKCHPSQWC